MHFGLLGLGKAMEASARWTEARHASARWARRAVGTFRLQQAGKRQLRWFRIGAGLWRRFEREDVHFGGHWNLWDFISRDYMGGKFRRLGCFDV